MFLTLLLQKFKIVATICRIYSIIYSFGTLLEFLHTKYNLMENDIQTTKLLLLMCVERGETHDTQTHADRLLLALISLRRILCTKQRKSAKTITLESSVETLNAKKCLCFNQRPDFVFLWCRF